MHKEDAGHAHQAGPLKIDTNRHWVRLKAYDSDGESLAEIKMPYSQVSLFCRALKNRRPLEFKPTSYAEGRISIKRELRGMKLESIGRGDKSQGYCMLSAHQAFQVADHLSQQMGEQNLQLITAR